MATRTKNSVRKEIRKANSYRSGTEVLQGIKWEQMSDEVGSALKSLLHGRDILRKAYGDHLEKMAPKKKKKEMTFALDGRLVGDIGELIAAVVFCLEILGTKSKKIDAKTTYGPKRKVQVKATFGKSSLSIKHGSDSFIGIQLDEEGRFRVVYNGPAKLVMDYLKSPASIGKKGRTNAGTKLEPISLAAWATLNLAVSEENRIVRRNPGRVTSR